MDDEGLADAVRRAIATGKPPAARVRRNYAGDIPGTGCPLCGSMMKHRDYLADVLNSFGVVTVHFHCLKPWQSGISAALTTARSSST